MKVFDCFTFFNELDLLELRLKLLDEVVDHFVIAESNLTHAGREKPYHFEAAKERFVQWQHKIIYIPVQQTIQGLIFNDNLTVYTNQCGMAIGKRATECIGECPQVL